jgi:polyisoprenoid-binding protein YceI
MRFHVTAGVLGALALASTAAHAAPAKPAAGNAAWVVNKAASSLTFRSNFDGDDFQGRFGAWDAQISFDPKNLAAAKVVATIQMNSARTGDASRDEMLPTAQWFDVAKYPRATFTSTSWKDMGGGKYQIAGALNLHGVTQPAVLNATIAVNGANARATGTATLDRSKFGVGSGQFRSADAIPFNVGVGFNIVAVRGK